MTAARLDQVAALENACFPDPWSRDSFEELLRRDDTLFLCAVEDDAVIGYVTMYTVVDEGYILNVAVDDRFRRRGVGTALIRALDTFGKKNSLAFITLEVRESNAPAIGLYSRFGFIKVGERKDYYRHPTENALLMTKFY